MTCYNFCHPGNVAGSVYVSGTTCFFGVGAFFLMSGECICIDVEQPYITCENPIFSGTCVAPTPTPTITPTQTTTQTPSTTPTNTPTQTSTQTQTPSSTPTQTPSVTPTQTSTQTPSVTPTNTETPTQTPSQTPTITPSPTCNPFTTQYLTAVIQGNDNIKFSLYDDFGLTINANAVCNYQYDGTYDITNGASNVPYTTIQASGDHIHTYNTGAGSISAFTVNTISAACPCVQVIYVLAPTPTPTATQTQTPSETPTNTPSNTATQTQTPSNTPTQTPSNTPTNTITPTITPSPTSTPLCQNCFSHYEIIFSGNNPTDNSVTFRTCDGNSKTAISPISGTSIAGNYCLFNNGAPWPPQIISSGSGFVSLSVWSGATNCCPPTPTPTPTMTSTPTRTATPTITPTRTATPTITPTQTPSNTPNLCNCFGVLSYTATTAGIITWRNCGDRAIKNFGVGAGSGVLTEYACNGPAGGIDMNSVSFNNTGFTYVLSNNCCVTPTATPTMTSTPTITPSITPSQTATRTMTPTPSITPSSTPNCLNCTAGFTVTGSSNNFTVTALKCFDRTIQSVSTTNGVATISVGCPGLDVGSITITTGGVSIVALQTQGDCCPVTPTPTTTSTPTQTPSNSPTPSITASQTTTPTQTQTPSITPTNSQTPSTTPPSTPTPTEQWDYWDATQYLNCVQNSAVGAYKVRVPFGASGTWGCGDDGYQYQFGNTQSSPVSYTVTLSNLQSSCGSLPC